MYLCIYIDTYLHTVYLDWQHAVIVSNSRCRPEDDDRVNSEIHLEAVIERVWRCNWRPRLSELRHALGGCDRASLEMQLETEIE